jgi:CobQ-like glutamine amidotransferase family enzyme
MNYEVPGLGIFDFSTTVNMFGRFTGKVMGTIDAIPQPIVGYKSQFSTLSSAPNVPGFLAADRGIGRNRTTAIEGVRVNNFIGTSLIGPVLVMNPHFTESLLRSIDPTRQPTLAQRELAIAAYDARVRDFNDSARWSRTELVVT